jgi:hypothetical protein
VNSAQARHRDVHRGRSKIWIVDDSVFDEITSKPDEITSKPDEITSKPDEITSKPDEITGESAAVRRVGERVILRKIK